MRDQKDCIIIIMISHEIKELEREKQRATLTYEQSRRQKKKMDCWEDKLVLCSNILRR